MNDNLFEIENWRGGWFYKFGSHYSGPFVSRDDAIVAATWELAPLKTHCPVSMRATLATPATA